MAKNSRARIFDEKLLAVYRERGIHTFLRVADEMLSIYDADNAEKKKRVHGELCEVVLKAQTLEYLSQRRVSGSIYHSVILNDLDNPTSRFRTELDFVLLTPYCCLTGECKSYSGELTVTDPCIITRGDLRSDLSRQSLLHGRHLKSHMKQFILPGLGQPEPPCGLFCYFYSHATVRDKRQSKYKELLPLLNVSTLYGYYDSIFRSQKKAVLDYEKAQKYLLRLQNSEQLHQEHKEFLGY